MKCLILLGFVAVASANIIPVAHHAALVNSGHSAQFRSQDNLGNYAFGYNEDHATGGTFRREQGDSHGNKVGSYGLRDADGRLRIVNYVADDFGFRANIQSNEPGVEPKDPAATVINKPGIVTPVVAAPAVHAPVVAAPAVHAPVVAAPHHAPLVAAPAHYAAPIAHAAPAHYAAAPAHYAAAPAHYAAPIAYGSAYNHALGYGAPYHF